MLISLLAPAQVFGGCCLNVYSLEAFLGNSGGFNAGAVISLAQLVSVCATALYPMVDLHQPQRMFLKKTNIPLSKLLAGALLFFTMSVLGNSIYSHGVSVPVQITFRSSSVVFSMAVNYLFGNKRYSRAQIASAGLMTIGSFLIISQHSTFTPINFGTINWKSINFGTINLRSYLSYLRPFNSKFGEFALGKSRELGLGNSEELALGKSEEFGLRKFASTLASSAFWSHSSAVGLLLLSVSSVLGAFLGLYTENVFAAHGRHWNEVLFYNHLVSVILLVLTRGAELRHGFRHIWSSSPRMSLSVLGHSVAVSKSALLLAINSITQVFCARGVNHLSSVASSLTVTVVLLVRKFVSLVISAFVFGNPFNVQGLVGSGLLITGTLLYAQCCQNSKPRKKSKESEKNVKNRDSESPRKQSRNHHK